MDIFEALEPVRIPGRSLAQSISMLPSEQREEVFSLLSELPPEDQARLQYDWRFWARPTQLPPNDCSDPECGCGGDWSIWVYLAGRASGKSRSGAEWLHDMADQYPGIRLGLISPTAGDVRRVMVEGVSGLLATQKPHNRLRYFPALLECRYDNGSHIGVFSADEADRLRGPQHHAILGDEFAAWKKAKEVWDMARLGLRLPPKPGWPRFRVRAMITTTPRPIDIIKQLVGATPYKKPRNIHVTREGTYANRENLDAEFFATIVSDLEGTRLGRQELEGEVLNDIPGALFKAEMIDPYRITEAQQPDSFIKTVVSIDPSVGGEEGETGIVVASTGPPPLAAADIGQTESHMVVAERLRRQQRTHGYVRADISLRSPSPDQWARAAVRAYYDYGADCIVVEANQGGDMAIYAIRTVDSAVPVRTVRATTGKKTRAEPVAALYEQGRIHHVGKFPRLENQMLEWDPVLSNKSPDRLDALVWAMHHLLGKGKIHHPVVPQRFTLRPSEWART